jgi:hypothetical protein
MASSCQMQSRSNDVDNESCTEKINEVSEQLNQILDKLDQVWLEICFYVFLSGFHQCHFCTSLFFLGKKVYNNLPFFRWIKFQMISRRSKYVKIKKIKWNEKLTRFLFFHDWSTLPSVRSYYSVRKLSPGKCNVKWKILIILQGTTCKRAIFLLCQCWHFTNQMNKWVALISVLTLLFWNNKP